MASGGERGRGRQQLSLQLWDRCCRAGGWRAVWRRPSRGGGGWIFCIFDAGGGRTRCTVAAPRPGPLPLRHRSHRHSRPPNSFSMAAPAAAGFSQSLVLQPATAPAPAAAGCNTFKYIWLFISKYYLPKTKKLTLSPIGSKFKNDPLGVAPGL